ncbi:S49 family peptidase [Aminobacter aminovorans]|uniref:S49 family peptidase n=1 Tax=Aminobacter aminovorans TaxID=83263 RepID=UPI002858015B|nr:S49 family peptidase [Aminobacter aminovorans]MDR7220350.1 signal peptide peptidase SppA [Aminobacter aminovorans]
MILSVLAGRIGVTVPEASRFEGDDTVRDENGNPVRVINRWGEPDVKRNPYNVSNGVGIITVTGSLVNRGAWIGANSGLTSYEGIQHQLKAIAADASVHSVILDLATPGGEAIGAFETAALVRSLAATKRTVALVNGIAASAGYAIASGASEIVTTETGLSGSIGVVMLHADFSRHLANEGISPTLIFAGDHKVDANPFEPLSKEVREDLEAEVTAFYDLFLKTVAEGRGARTTVDMARATQARTFMGAAAVAAGLADRLGTFESVLSELSRAAQPNSGGRSTVQQRRPSMDKTNGAPDAASNAGITQADFDEAVRTAVLKGREDGAKAERDRLAGIEANALPGHEALIAAHKADSAMTPEKSAVAILAAEKAKPQDVRKGLEKLDKAAEGVNSTPSMDGDAGGHGPKATTPEGWAAEWQASSALQAEFPTAESYVATKKREAARA